MHMYCAQWRSQEFCMGGAKYTNTICLLFTLVPFYFFIDLDKILRSTQSMGGYSPLSLPGYATDVKL